MDNEQQNQKDVSKVFAFLRSKLNGKEKELLELQRAEPCLLAPDCEQINLLVDAISSLHLSTQDGSFIFASKSVSNESCSTSVCSTGVDSIKTLPSTLWLSESVNIKQKENEINEYRLPMVTHLLSLPPNAFISSSSNNSPLSSIKTAIENENQRENHLPVVNQLLSMPIDAFKSSSSSSSSSNVQSIKKSSFDFQIENTKQKNNDNKQISSTNNVSKSIFDIEKIYSKEHWLKKSSSTESESVPLDLDTYIQQTTEKMRRLHMEYVEALEKLKTPSDPINSPETLKSIYPKIFNRITEDILSTKPH